MGRFSIQKRNVIEQPTDPVAMPAQDVIDPPNAVRVVDAAISFVDSDHRLSTEFAQDLLLALALAAVATNAPPSARAAIADVLHLLDGGEFVDPARFIDGLLEVRLAAAECEVLATAGS